MSAPLEICSKRRILAILASGVVISLTALTGGVAPAFAKPNTDQVVTTTVPVPEPKVAPEETEAPSHKAPPKAPATLSVAPSVESPPQTQQVIEPSAPPVTQSTTSPVVTAIEPASPTTAVNTPETKVESASPSSSAATTPSSGSAMPGSETKASASQSYSATTTAGGPTLAVSQAAKVIEPSEPKTLQAPKEDVELASNAKPVEVKPEPAATKDVEEFSNSIGLDLGAKGPLGVDASAKVDARLTSDRVWDHPVRQWNPDWVRYDEYYRPIICNPYHERVWIIYIYDNRPRIVWIDPLSRIVLEVAQFAAYSFTAVVATAANLVNAAVDTAVNVAVGSFFGGGYYPGIGLPLPPPRVLRYDNVPVLVRYSHATYEPFRVRRIVDVGDDFRFGERKVLLDGATPAWGVWTQTLSGERQFEVHRTQQFPGLDDPQEAPLPGDYQLRLASDETSSGLSARDTLLYVAAGVTVALGFGAIALALMLGRRRPQH